MSKPEEWTEADKKSAEFYARALHAFMQKWPFMESMYALACSVKSMEQSLPAHRRQEFIDDFIEILLHGEAHQVPEESPN